METILIITEDRNTRSLLEGELRQNSEIRSLSSGVKESMIMTDSHKLHIVDKGNEHKSSIYDEVKYLTKDSVLNDMLHNKLEYIASEVISDNASDSNGKDLQERIVDLQAQVLQLQQEKAKLEQDLIKVHLESVEGVSDKFKKEVKLDPALCFLKALTQINNEIEKHMNKKDDYWTGN